MAESDIITTAEQLAQALPVSAELLALAESDWDQSTQSRVRREISAKDARESVYQSLRAILGNPEQSSLFSFSTISGSRSEAEKLDLDIRSLAEVIVKALPEEAMTRAVIQAMDVRPYLQLIAEQTATNSAAAENAASPLVSTRLTNAWQLVNESDVAAGGTPYRPESQIRPVQTTATPASDVSGTASPGGTGGVYQYPVPGSNMVDLGDVAYMLRTGQADITNPDLAGQPIDMGSLSGVFTNAPNGKPRASQRELPNRKVIGRTTIGGALDWTYGLNEQEVTSLQSMLANAGYMTDMRYDTQNDRWIMRDMQYEEGYANDPVFQAAWKMALQEAKANESSVGAWLMRKTGEFKQREEALRTRLTEERLGAFNSALTDVRAAADRLAIETVGRRLKPEEYVQVRQYLRSLQTDRADDVAGATAEPWMTSDPNRGFTQDELATQVQDVVEPEVMQRQGMSMNYQMKKWLGMD